MRILRWLLPGLFLLIGLFANAQNIPPRPNPPTLVNDFAKVLLGSEDEALERRLVAYNDSTSTQIAIVTVKSIGDYDISQVALKILRDWGIGSKEKNNGLLILVAVEDRKIRIETGYGMEGVVPDAVANDIINNFIKPAFREGNYYKGLDDAVTAIEKAAAGEYKGSPKKESNISIGGVFLLIMLVVIIIAVISRGGGGGGGTTYNRRGGWIWPVIGGMSSGWGSGSSGSGWSGGGGGGGFGGFGGGSGGGGGASGSW